MTTTDTVKSPRRLRLEKRLEKAFAEQAGVEEEKRQLLMGGATRILFDSFNDLYSTVTGLENQGVEATEKITELRQKLNELTETEKYEFNSDWDARIAEFDFVVMGQPVKMVGEYIGMVNPAVPEKSLRGMVPQARDGRHSLVFLATPHGSLKRSVVSADEIFETPQDHLGEPVVLTSKGYNRKTVRGLFVVGYIDRFGTKFGYVPNAKFHMYSA